MNNILDILRTPLITIRDVELYLTLPFVLLIGFVVYKKVYSDAIGEIQMRIINSKQIKESLQNIYDLERQAVSNRINMEIRFVENGVARLKKRFDRDKLTMSEDEQFSLMKQTENLLAQNIINTEIKDVLYHSYSWTELADELSLEEAVELYSSLSAAMRNGIMGVFDSASDRSPEGIAKHEREAFKAAILIRSADSLRGGVAVDARDERVLVYDDTFHPLDIYNTGDAELDNILTTIDIAVDNLISGRAKARYVDGTIRFNESFIYADEANKEVTQRRATIAKELLESVYSFEDLKSLSHNKVILLALLNEIVKLEEEIKNDTGKYTGNGRLGILRTTASLLTGEPYLDFIYTMISVAENS